MKGFWNSFTCLFVEQYHINDTIIIIPSPFSIMDNNLSPSSSTSLFFHNNYRMALEPGQLRNTMFGPMPGPGSRYYSLGAILTHISPTGGKHRISAQYDIENNNGKSTFLSDIYGDGRLRIQGQLVDARNDKQTEWGLTSTLRGEDYVLVNRLKHNKEFGLSYNQRIAPGSPLTIGGEMFFNYPALLRMANPSKADETTTSAGKPLEYAIGCAYDDKINKTAIHLATTSSFSNILSFHHLYRVSDRSSLAAKFMCTPTLGTSMASAGYRVKFRNTLSSITGVVDTYGTVRLLVDREPVKDIKISASMEARIGPQASPGPEGTATLGFRVIIGTPSPIVAPLSPCTMSRDIFSAA